MNARAFAVLVVALAFVFAFTACTGSSSMPTVKAGSVVMTMMKKMRNSLP